jgi:ABC-type transport system substrate-binding protein
MAIDRAAIANQTGYQDNSGVVAYNPKKAKQMLDAAGWTVLGNKRVKNGQVLAINLVIPGGVSVSRSEAELIQNMLAQVNVGASKGFTGNPWATRSSRTSLASAATRWIMCWTRQYRNSIHKSDRASKPGGHADLAGGPLGDNLSAAGYLGREEGSRQRGRLRLRQHRL